MQLMTGNRLPLLTRVIFITLLLVLSIDYCHADQLPADVRARIREATVLVESFYRPVEDPDAEAIGPFTGSGVIIASEGLVITNAHCVESAMQWDARANATATQRTPATDRVNLVLIRVKIHLKSGRSDTRSFDAQVLATRPLPVDLALLRIRPQTPLPTLDLLPDSEFEQLRETLPVWAIGFPRGHAVEDVLTNAGRLTRNPFGPDLDFRDGTISSLRRDGTLNTKVVSTTCQIEQGNSGGPLVDRYGRVIGINYLLYGRAHSFAIPIHVALSQFQSTLASRRPVAEESQVEKKILTITPAERMGAVAVQPFTLGKSRDYNQYWAPFAAGSQTSLEFACESARPGDTIELPKGEYELPRALNIPAGVWVRGAGISETKIVLTSFSATINLNQPGYVEFSDLTISGYDQNASRADVTDDGELQSGPWNTCLQIGANSGQETYVHNIAIESRSWGSSGMRISGESSPNVVAVTAEHSDNIPWADPGVVIAGAGGRPRLERCHFRGYANGVIISRKAQPTLDGCSIDATKTAIRVRTNAVPTISCCRLSRSGSGTDGGLVEVVAAEADFSGNVFAAYSGYCDTPSVSGGSRVNFTGNVFYSQHQRQFRAAVVKGDPNAGIQRGIALVVDGANTRVTFAANIFDGCRYVPKAGVNCTEPVSNLMVDSRKKK